MIWILCTLRTYIQEWAIAEQKEIEEKQEHSKPKEGNSWILVWNQGYQHNCHLTFDPRICMLSFPHPSHTHILHTSLTFTLTTSHTQ